MSKGIEYLFKKNNVAVVKGTARITGTNTVSVTDEQGATSVFEADYILVATGSRSKNLPLLPIDGKAVIGYREALTLRQMPSSVVVVGSGAIGVEMSYFYASMGSQVTLVEYMPSIVPQLDADVSEPLERSLKKMKVKVLVDSQVTRFENTENGYKVFVETPKGTQEIVCDVILSVVGVEANIETIGLEDIGVITERGKVVVDSSFRTSVPTVFAIGDIIATPSLAHVASAEALACVEALAGISRDGINYRAIPSCIYTSPEIASVGFYEKQLIESGIAYTVGKFPFSALGKATAVGAREGFAKLLFSKNTGLLLGAHLVGHSVTEMLSEIVLAIDAKVDAHHLLRSIHPHPTMSESIMEAAAVACGEAVHV